MGRSVGFGAPHAREGCLVRGYLLSRRELHESLLNSSKQIICLHPPIACIFNANAIYCTMHSFKVVKSNPCPCIPLHTYQNHAHTHTIANIVPCKPMQETIKLVFEVVLQNTT